MSITHDPATQLPTGTWRVDPGASTLEFGARGMFGLASVRGRFTDFDGTLSVRPDGSRGELHIRAATLDSGNAKRDRHLRSADFFDVEAHPDVTFDLTSITSAAGGALEVAGTLRIRETALPVQAPAQFSADDPSRLTLTTTLDVDRAAAGVGWSKFGLIKGPAHLSASVTMTREA